MTAWRRLQSDDRSRLASTTLGVTYGTETTPAHDIEAGMQSGRFTIRDPELALTIVAGAALCLGQLLHDYPERDDADAADQVTEALLCMLGVPADEARDICQRPLPSPDDLTGRDSAA